jgi:hypothetical protein
LSERVKDKNAKLIHQRAPLNSTVRTLGIVMPNQNQKERGDEMIEDNTITIRRIRTGSIFRIVAAGTFLSITPFFILMGVLAAFGMDTLKWNDQPVLGLRALIAGPFMGLFAAAVFTAMMGLMLSLGLWLYSKFRPLSIRVLLDGTSAAATAP